jgi:hypothetical protein
MFSICIRWMTGAPLFFARARAHTHTHTLHAPGNTATVGLPDACYIFLPARISNTERRETTQIRDFMFQRPCIFEWNCIMTNVMHKFLIYLSLYFCLTCFGLYFSPSSEADVLLRRGSSFFGGMVSAPGCWHFTKEAWTTSKLCICLWRCHKTKPETCKARSKLINK